MKYKTLLQHTESKDFIDVKQMFAFFTKHSDAIFMNNAAITLVPKYVIDNLHQYDYLPLTAYRSFSEYKYEEIISQLRAMCLQLFALNEHKTFFGSNSSDVTNKISLCLRSDNKHNKTHILLSIHNHNSNIVPWLYLAQQQHLNIVWFDTQNELESHLDAYTYLVAFSHISNVDGRSYNLSSIFHLCRENNIFLIIDATQSCLFEENMKSADVVFFSSQKYFAHPGVGVAMLSNRIQQSMNIDVGGGGSIDVIDARNKILHKDLPYSLEYGTYNSLALLSLYFALLFRQNTLEHLSYKNHMQHLHKYFLQKYDVFAQENALTTSIYRNSNKAIFSLCCDDINAHDISDELTKLNIYNRAGNHCAAKYFENTIFKSSTRISLSFYNNKDEIDILFDSLQQIFSAIKHE